MNSLQLPLDGGRSANLVLAALIRTLLAKGVLDEADVRALATEAARGLDAVSGEALSTGAAQALAASELLPALLGDAGATAK